MPISCKSNLGSLSTQRYYKKAKKTNFGPCHHASSETRI